MGSTRIALLGVPHIDVDDVPLRVDTRKAVALLAYLGVVGEPQPRDTLVTLLWPDSDPDRGRGALRRTLSTIRSAAGADLLVTDRFSVALSGDAWVDVVAFRRHLDEVDRHGDTGRLCDACVDRITEAGALWRGRFLEGFGLRDAIDFEDWQLVEGEALQRELTMALDRLVEHHLAAEETAAAAAAAERRLAVDPLHEPSYRTLMRLAGAAGDRAGAIRWYRECLRVLDAELGVTPVEETTAVYRAVTTGAQFEEQATPFRPMLPDLAVLPYLGHEATVEPLAARLLAPGTPAAAAVEGEPGSGVSRTLEEVADAARRRGHPVFVSRAHSTESRLPLAPLAQLLGAAVSHDPDAATRVPAALLAAAARAVPALGIAPVSAGAPDDAIRLYEAVGSLFGALAEADPSPLFVVDDLHEADPSTLEMLGYILRRRERWPVRFLFGWTSTATRRSLCLQLMALDGGEAVHRLERWDRNGVAAAASSILGGVTDSVVNEVYAETEGLPLLVVEYLRATRSGDWPGGLPAGARDALRARIAGLDDVTARVAAAAAVAAGPFDSGLVGHASARSPEETVRALEELVGQGIITEVASGDYEFTHPRLRDSIYDDTTAARRRLLHRRTAEALRAQAGATPAATVAYHYEAAGEAKAAATFHVLAGEAAAEVPAVLEAIGHFRTALGLDHPDRSELRERIGDMLVLAGRYDEAVVEYETAAAHGSAPSALLEHKLGRLRHRRGDHSGAFEHFRTALALAGDDPIGVEILVDWSVSSQEAGDDEAAVRLAGRALAGADRHPGASPVAVARARAVQAIGLGDEAEARRHLQEAVAAAAFPDPARIAVLNTLARLALGAGDADAAGDYAEQAIEVSVRRGDRHLEGVLRSMLADARYARGDMAGAEDQIRWSAALLADVGREEDRIDPEIWKLVRW